MGTRLRTIGALPDHPRIHAVIGYGGNAILFSQTASEIARRRSRAQKRGDAALFAFKA